MSITRRQVLSMIVAAAPAARAAHALTAQPAAGAIDWSRVRTAFPVQRPLVNLNNAGMSPMTKATEAALIKACRFANENPDRHMWDVLDADIPKTKARLARLADCHVDEIALHRNATEGLCTAIFGCALSAGDEVLLGPWDYASMRRAWEQRAARERISVVPVRYSLMDDDDAIVDAYRRAITNRMKAMQLTHMVHWTGRVLPVARLCALARERDILTIVDGAQSFAHVPLSVHEIGCDYFVASLHKWLTAPAGNGMTVIRKDRLASTWPLLAPYDPEPGIGSFDGFNQGTYFSPAQHAIQSALDFHESLGVARIHERLRFLTSYWVAQAKTIPGFRLHTPIDHPLTGGVSLCSIAGVNAQTLEQRLAREYGIRVRFRKVADLEGLRVSPHLYTSTSELDRFVSGLRQVAKG